MNMPPITIINSEALACALAQQPKPLPEALEQSLQATQQAIQQDNTEAIRHAAQTLRQQIRQYPPLEVAYKAALQKWDQQYASQERAKSITATLPNMPIFPGIKGLEQFWLGTSPHTEWVDRAKQVTSPQLSQPVSFWDKTDRVAVMIAGGAALGSAVGQIPGAIVGTLVAGGYGWYISFNKTKSGQNSNVAAMDTTTYLLQSEANRKRLLQSVENVENRVNLVEVDPEKFT